MKLYIYKAYVRKCYDADTITIDLDLGFDIVLKNRNVRIYGIDTPEMRPKKKGRTAESIAKEKALAKEARDYVRGLILKKKVLVKTHKDESGKFGRILLDVILDDGKMLSDVLISKRYAKPYFGEKKEEWVF